MVSSISQPPVESIIIGGQVGLKASGVAIFRSRRKRLQEWDAMSKGLRGTVPGCSAWKVGEVRFVTNLVFAWLG
jgi:hypothetical protein